MHGEVKLAVSERVGFHDETSIWEISVDDGGIEGGKKSYHFAQCDT